jgi:AraC-like DNA-binding protein
MASRMTPTTPDDEYADDDPTPWTPRRTEIHTDDAASARRYLAAAYGPDLRVDGLGGGTIHHTRLQLGPLAIDDLVFPAELDYLAESLGLMVLELRSGVVQRDLGGASEFFEPGDVALLSQPGLAYRARSRDADARVVALESASLAQVVDADHDDPVRFVEHRPRTVLAARRWRRTTAYLTEMLWPVDPGLPPLVAGNAVRLLVATALSTFANTAVLDPTPVDRRDAGTATLRRAQSFIEEHVGQDITAADIAAAAGVTIRAAQLAFRRHLDTTPMSYLRRTRLDRARRDIVDADPRGPETVTSIAGHWGFPNASRFARLYRTVYGVAPRDDFRAR